MEGSSESSKPVVEVEEPLVLKNRSGRPRKYATPEEAKEAKLRKDRENYERKNPGVEHGKVGRKAIRTIEEIREKEREYQRRRRERKKGEIKE